MSIRQELQKLVDLQLLDSRAAELQARLDQVPIETEKLESELEDNRQTLAQADQLIEDQKAERRKRGGEVTQLREKLSKFKTQLMEVKTNKEYQAVLGEIAATEGHISDAEDRVLELMLSADEGLEEVTRLRKQFETTEKDILERKKELDDFVATAAAEMKELQSKREALVQAVPEEMMSRYQRIASARNGLAMAPTDGNSCRICHVRLRPQLFTEIRTSQRIITCENCNRILYYEQPEVAETEAS